MNEKEVMKAAEQVYEMFSEKHKINVYLEFVDEDEFFELSGKSKIVREEVKEGLPVKIGSLVAHSNGQETIILCIDVLNFLSKDIDFVKALVLHELYHVLYRKEVKKQDKIDRFFASEERVHKHFRQEFPEFAMLLDF